MKPGTSRMTLDYLRALAGFSFMDEDTLTWAADEIESLRARVAGLVAERDRLQNHWKFNRGELSGYTVGEVEYVESRLRAAEAERDALKADYDDRLARMVVKFSETPWLARNVELEAENERLQARIDELGVVPEIDRRIRARIETNRLRAAVLSDDGSEK